LICPSSNHFEYGSFQSSTFLKSRIQVSSARAVSAQNPSGSSIDRR
jgi:hypothetical protein